MANFKDLSIEDLEKALEQSKKDDKRKKAVPPISKSHDSVLDYIKDKGIASGSIKVPNSVIFYDYRVNYPKQHNNKKVGRVSFFHTFAQHFTQVRSGTTRYYMLNIDLDKNDDFIARAKAYSSNYTKTKRKKSKD